MESKKVLYWADFKKSFSRHLIERLKEKCPNYEFDVLDEIWRIKEDSFDLDQYDIVLLQSTDVTKFSANETERNIIEERLDDFADSGKKIIVSHDVIYRRTRNKRLQEMFNYQIINFHRSKEVKYSKTPYCKRVNAFSSLQSDFKLNDGEVCWGSLDSMDDKKIFFDTIIQDPETGKKIVVPLVFGKLYNCDGQLIWFNTGDTFENPPQPITSLDDNFINLLAECLKINIKELKETTINVNHLITKLHPCDFSKPFTFISYSNKNDARVYEICLFLDKLGINYFLDFKNISAAALGSDGWKDDVSRALNHVNCTSAFIFISEDFLNSDNCFYEVQEINKISKKFVPILMSISMNPERILQEINSWSALTDDALEYKNLLAIR
ncbi:MAG TPA: hypothetical protein DCY93_01990, partial [Firmicutes bacterium]|nr:hypothetical protein [Bacillota bacterium]